MGTFIGVLSPAFATISSILVREIAFLDGRITGLAPKHVAYRLYEKTTFPRSATLAAERVMLATRFPINRE